MPKIRERICSSVSSSWLDSDAAEAETEATSATGGDVDEANERGDAGREENGARGDDDDGVDVDDVEAMPPRATTKLAAAVPAAVAPVAVLAIEEIHALCSMMLHAPRPFRARARPFREAISKKRKKENEFCFCFSCQPFFTKNLGGSFSRKKTETRQRKKHDAAHVRAGVSAGPGRFGALRSLAEEKGAGRVLIEGNSREEKGVLINSIFDCSLNLDLFNLSFRHCRASFTSVPIPV